MNKHIHMDVRILPVRIIAGSAIAAGAVTGCAAFWGTATAHATTQPIAANYSCTQPGSGPLSATVTWQFSSNFPDTVTVGEPTGTRWFHVTEEVPASTVQEMRQYYGISAVKGSGTSSITDFTPQGRISYTLAYDIPPTPLPSSGPAEITAEGEIPSFTYTRPGTAKSTVGKVISNVTMLDASGNPTYPGSATSTCNPASGQNIAVQTFTIDPAPKPKPTVPAAAPATTRPQTTLKPSPSPKHSARPSSSRTALATPATSSVAMPSSSGGTSSDQTLIIIAAGLASAAAGGLAVWQALRNRT